MEDSANPSSQGADNAYSLRFNKKHVSASVNAADTLQFNKKHPGFSASAFANAAQTGAQTHAKSQSYSIMLGAGMQGGRRGSGSGGKGIQEEVRADRGDSPVRGRERVSNRDRDRGGEIRREQTKNAVDGLDSLGGIRLGGDISANNSQACRHTPRDAYSASHQSPHLASGVSE